MDGPILVTGASGVVGRELVRLLARTGAEVRAGVHRPPDARPSAAELPGDRSPAAAESPGDQSPAAAELPDAVRAVHLDFAEADTVIAACAGVRIAYLLTPQIPAATGYVRAFLELAKTAGVERIVRQSMHDAENGRDALSRWHRGAEEAVFSSGLSWTVLRPNAFMQNFVTIYAPTIRTQGIFRLPIGEARLSSVDARDVAAAAVSVILQDGHEDTAYTLTGPEALTGAEMAEILSAGIGREVRHIDEAEDAGQPPADPEGIAVSEALVELSAEMRAGKLASVSDDLRQLTGRRPAAFADFVRDYREAWM